ncbi:hypothetical protein HPB47_006193 [Ixodes persulcatus]|uniref:Uncharacterized protein n=1 Tax=Ixodes persulcatus TaxID=34615 RepID=A0AC60PB06_IXOPE|nr:hypothetical protein HPB47_006193 [Ixodes persulcatus]
MPEAPVGKHKSRSTQPCTKSVAAEVTHRPKSCGWQQAVVEAGILKGTPCHSYPLPEPEEEDEEGEEVVTPDLPSKNFVCGFCNSCFSSLAYLNRHRKMRHLPSEGRHRCRFCPYSNHRSSGSMSALTIYHADILALQPLIRAR